MKKAVVSLSLILMIGALYKLQGTTASTASDTPYIKAVYSKPVSYDPAQMNDGASLIFSELAYEGLLRFTEDYGIQSALAKTWETSSDGKTLTFKLHDKAQFHNGEPVTAEDVLISLTRVVAPESTVYKYYDMIEGATEYHNKKADTVTGLKALDNKTIQIKLKNPYPPIMYVLAGGTAKILPASVLTNKDFFKKPIGAGPFKIESIDETDITLKQAKNYHGKKPSLNTMILRAIDQTSAMEQATSGKLHDLSSWPLSGLEDVFKSGQNISTVVADTWIIGFNLRLAPLNDLKTRKAFKQSINSEKFRKLFYPSAAQANGYIPVGFPGYIATAQTEAKLEVPPHKPITIVIPEGLDKTKEIAEFFETDLKAQGWKINTKIMTWPTMMKAYQEKTMQAFLVSMIVDYPDSEFLLGNFASNNPDNYSGVSDRKIDSLLAKARTLQDRVKRHDVYESLAKRVNDLALSANLFHSKQHYWIHDCVRNFKPNLLAVAYIDYRNVSLDSKCINKTTHIKAGF